MQEFIFKFMKKILLILSLIIFLSFSYIFANSFPYEGDLSVGTDITDKYYNSYMDLLLPVYGNETSFLFLSPKMNMMGKSFLESSSNGNSIGIGYRKYHENLFNMQAITGINVYYDNIRTKNGNNFQQLGAGLEVFTDSFDFKINGYFPFSYTEKFLKKSFDLFEEHKIAATDYYESALCGFDTEIGIKLPITDKLGIFHIFGGYYMFNANKLKKDLKGLKATFEYKPINLLKLSFTLFENENLQETNWMTNFSLNIPFNFKKLVQAKNPLNLNKRSSSLKQRIGETVTRDTIKIVYPKIEHSNEILKFDETNDCYFIVTSVNGNGNGTFEDPANLQDALTLAKAVTGNNCILLFLGGKYDIPSTLNLNDFNADNILISGKQEIEYMGADLSKITNVNPILHSTNETIFSIDNSQNERFVISSMEFLPKTENGNNAVEIKNMEKTFSLQNNSFKNFESAVNITNSSSNTVVYNNIFENNYTAVNLKNTSAVVTENIFSKNTTNAINVYDSDDVTIYSNLIKNNLYGITVNLSANTQIVYNELSNNTFAVNSSSSTYSYISSNIMYKNEEDAIISNFDTENTITENILTENNNGINIINGNKNLILGNRITNNKTNGIYAKNIDSCHISKNNIGNNMETGIFLEDSVYTEISTNTVSYNKTGISLNKGNDICVSGNTAISGETAIYATNVSTLTVVLNTISSSTVCAMNLSNMEIGLIKSNSVSNITGTAGLSANNLTDFSFENNNFFQNSGNGLNITNSQDIFLVNNMFSYTNGNGLSLGNTTNISLFYNIFNNNNAVSTVFGLYFKNDINFTSSSGNNIFYNSNYSGDNEAVQEYEQKVKPNDIFY